MVHLVQTPFQRTVEAAGVCPLEIVGFQTVRRTTGLGCPRVSGTQPTVAVGG